jgi:predicted NBD/HSP70 family sugar kinase
MFEKIKINPLHVPKLDKNFMPAALVNQEFRKALANSKKETPVFIAILRGNNFISTYKTAVFEDGLRMDDWNNFYIERLIKSLLWIRGGWKIVLGGSNKIGEYIKKAYSPGGIREFDAVFMSKVYEKPFEVIVTEIENVPFEKEETRPIGRHLEGYRIGFDAGGSDRKVAAVIDGKPVYSEEIIWHPKTETNPEYHYREIHTAIKTAASYLPKVDAIGVSAAGIYIDNRVMVASLFKEIPEELFEKKIKNIFLDIKKVMGNVPLEVSNDGDVTALAGAMELEDTNVLGIAMGTSEAGGYVDQHGNLTGWLNELAFVPVDFNPKAMLDEWSGDFGCGVKYFSQDAVIKLAPAAGVVFSKNLTPAEKLKVVQELLEKGDRGAKQIFEDIGCYLGYSLAHYADFYDIKHVLILGRVTSGKGGEIIRDNAKKVLKDEFPKLAKKLQLHLPDENSRRVGQAIAAAGLAKSEQIKK